MRFGHEIALLSQELISIVIALTYHGNADMCLLLRTILKLVRTLLS